MRVGGASGLTARMARGPRWRSTSRGLFLPVDGDAGPGAGQVAMDPGADRAGTAVDQRIVEASMICPDDGAITGWAALRWLSGSAYFGGTYAGRPLPITLSVGRRHVRRRPGVAVSAEFVLPEEIVEEDGIRVTVPTYAATFAARHAPDGEEAVRLLDMAMMADLVSREELVDFTLRRLATTTGIAQLEAALCLASENCWSPPEATMRLRWEVGLGLRRPLSNRPVFSLTGEHLGTPDLIDPVAGVVGEYDGAHHFLAGRQQRDAERAEGFRAAGLEYVVMTADDLTSTTGYLTRLAAAHDRALTEDRARGWTMALPAYWVPTHTVDQRRALTPKQRERFLGWQRLAVARPGSLGCP